MAILTHAQMRGSVGAHASNPDAQLKPCGIAFPHIGSGKGGEHIARLVFSIHRQLRRRREHSALDPTVHAPGLKGIHEREGFTAFLPHLSFRQIHHERTHAHLQCH